MPPPFRVFAGAVILAGALAPCRAGAQASPYLPLDDPRLPLIEHLIARGDITDPTPMVRPFRRADALRALAEADSAADRAGHGSPLVHALRESLEEPPGDQTWRVAARAGGQAFSHVRRDVLHPLGPDGVRPYADFTGEAVIGPFALVTRPAAEPRIVDDPEWPGRKDLTLAWRMVEAYASAQFSFGNVFYGQMDRNWGPVGVPGIPLSDYGYPQVEAGFLVGTRARTLELEALARSLTDARDTSGAVVHRYFFAHRASARLSDRVRLGLWETTVLSGVDRAFDGRYRNPLSLLLLANQYGLGADGNVLFGADLHWRVRGRTTLQAQLAIDDFQYQGADTAGRYPNRWALTVGAFGPLGRALSWRGLYTQASSLAFRTLDPFENFTDAGVGIGRNFDDMDQLTLTVGVPGGTRWLFTPELTLLRQGEGEIDAPFPATAGAAGAIPQLFIGVVERTWRAALDVSGRQGPLDLHLNAGLHHVVNAGHVAGTTVNRFEGRLQATLGLGRRGVLQ
ncbi:MAG TPA: hypothetical protein VHL81_04720 [Gemmatimonadales bacterium]|jgi:hypothetical protein|nr:hypothetical protein [Gemmatimonadales bacterium]